MVNKQSKIIILLSCYFVIFSVVFLLPNIVFAQADLGLNAASNIGLSTPAESDLRVVLVNIVRYFLGFIGIIATAVILYAGFLWMTSAGRSEQLAKAKQTLISGMVGLIITLSAFAIVTFIVNLFEGGGGGLGRSNRPGGSDHGIGALGACAVESVYPASGQEDVPRNSSIIVTFKKDITETDIIDTGQIVAENVHIYLSAQGDSCNWVTDHYEDCSDTNLIDVSVVRTGRTFVFTPNVLMGNANGNTNYSIRLDEAITDTDGNSIFEDCRVDNMIWSFEVSNRLDLVPPQVDNSGVTPVPDDNQDTVNSTSAVAAQGTITVLEQPQVRQVAEATYVSGSGIAATDGLVVDPINSEESQVDVNLPGSGDGITAQLSRSGTGILLGSAIFDGRTVVFPGYFTLTAENDVSTGNLWTINLTARQNADTLTVGNDTYSFVNIGAVAGEINRGGNINATVANIVAELNTTNISVVAVNSSPSIDLTASSAGASGNSIELRTNNSSKFSFTAMSSGADAYTELQTTGMPDPPRNILIQIDFNEAINPATVSGDSAQVTDAIQVRCLSGACVVGTFACGVNTCINGRFEISNQYKTIEFIPEIECGVNSCGEQVYCLPSNSNIEVWLHAASLENCADNADCISRQSFNVCDNAPGNGNHCNNGTDYYPLSNLNSMDGVMDTANNSLDGNRDDVAYGPSTSDYNENDDLGTGDNYLWSFWVSDLIDTTPPIINSISPGINGSDVELDVPLEVIFSKAMQSSSLRTGESKSRVGADLITHRHINLWNYANRATGYWITNEDVRDVQGFPISTIVYINHSVLGPLLTYRIQVGSGVRDIYQNCFRPAEGPDLGSAPFCDGTSNSCCDGAGVVGETCD